MDLGALDPGGGVLGAVCLEKMCLRKVRMTVAEKKECLEKWIAKFPFLEPYVVKADNVLEHTNDVDALCRSLVKDYLVCNRLSEKYGRKTSMLSARDNMLYKKDIRVESRDGKMVSLDTKYPKQPFSKGGEMWLEVEKIKASKADKLMYVGPDGYCWVIDRKRCLEALASKSTYIGRWSGDVMCKFTFEELDRHEAIREFAGLEGVFDDVEGDLHV